MESEKDYMDDRSPNRERGSAIFHRVINGIDKIGENC